MTPRPIYRLAIVLCLFFILSGGCSPSSPPEEPAAPDVTTQVIPVPKSVLGRAGTVTMERPEYRQAISEARALQQWRSGKPAPLKALENMMLRRRVLTKALETRVLRAETQRRRLVPEMKVVNALLTQAASGKPPSLEQARATQAVPLSSEKIEAGLAKRFGGLAPHVRQAAMDVIEAGLLADALLDEVPDSRLMNDWRRENTRIVLDLVRVPRVPSTVEISRGVRTMQAQMKAYHAKESKYFRKPARVFVRRMALPWPSKAPVRTKAELKELAISLKARVDSGEDMIALVREFGAKQDHRSGGKLTIKKEKRPKLFALPKGQTSAIEEVKSGLVFYRIEGRAPEMNRPFTDSRVQREIAAALLRKSDNLPEARGIANRVQGLLGSESSAEALGTLVKEKRLRRSTTSEFAQSRGNAVPTIGLAPELFKAVFELRASTPVSPVVTVRQDYVVARLVKRTTVSDDDWGKERTDYAKRWKTSHRPRMVDEFLNGALKGEALWVDMKQLEALSIEQLGPSEQKAMPPTR